jgi:flavin reductase (DIM6/NTAB) family NADH-FMN oxidoreductase RutF
MSGSHGGIATGAAARSLGRGTPADTAPTPEAMRAARRRWASGVTIVTTIERDGDAVRYRGATVSAFTVVSLEPPLVLICLEREATITKRVTAADIFAVSILDRSQEFHADRFAGLAPLPDPRFTSVPHDLGPTGCPLLRGALAAFDCRVSAVHDGGDHVIVVGEVLAVVIGPDTDDPLLTYEGAYRRLESA